MITQQELTLTLSQQIERCLRTANKIVRVVVNDAQYIPPLQELRAQTTTLPEGYVVPNRLAFIADRDDTITLNDEMEEPMAIHLMSELEFSAMSRAWDSFRAWINTSDVPTRLGIPRYQFFEGDPANVPLVYDPQSLRQALLTALMVECIREKTKRRIELPGANTEIG